MARVLVVDDDLAVLELVVGCLVALDHQVFAASDGLRAREVFDAGRVDVLVTDVRMPGLDGFGLVEHVRSLPHPVHVVMMSGSWTAEERARASALGIARLYTKPLDLAQLARDVEDLAR